MSRSWHDLHHPDSRLSLYLRALGKRKIRGSQLPGQGLRCFLRVDADNLAAYRRLCHFADDGRLPGTYPHVMAFSLQLQLLTANDFPFPLLGLVHLHNNLQVLRPLGGIDGLRFAVYADNLQPHEKGGTFDLVTEAEDGLGLLWRETSRMLVRGLKLDPQAAEPQETEPAALPEATRWYADSDIGRRYARVCGDYNPIHLSNVTARLFGFPRAIAHGMWSTAMALAALQGHLPKAGYAFAVDFRKPVRLPSEVVLSASEAGPEGALRLDGHGGLVHMVGSWRSL
ncbi:MULTISPECIES: MaoC/PaaZ C-terminal domain-containing protein [unclassified Pseudomonas]|uniref:MaoC family dehydratase n=1 Tax=unclassified Pseudomonas TaxID=196821 RepID=UPI0024475A80|nr:MULTISPECIES: MaoC/PaaZ C-terminal domain-containing protein [unclassified Pseudomonas]MDH0305275.1 MaoC/PaaZ C-terminal domain-containing protein [Pseudomonas sp. GD04091]MDH1986872.1 MaoC/PaaZ C-terminal domain-containing protein [Pseudomonas sp. GD03689]